MHGVEERFLNAPRDGPRRTIADHATIELFYRRDLDGRPGEEQLVRGLDIGERQRTDFGRDLQISGPSIAPTPPRFAVP